MPLLRPWRQEVREATPALTTATARAVLAGGASATAAETTTEKIPACATPPTTRPASPTSKLGATMTTALLAA